MVFHYQFTDDPDLIFFDNNGNVAVKPASEGRLRSLRLRVREDMESDEGLGKVHEVETVWTFGSHTSSSGRVDLKKKEVLTGTLADWEAFKDLCQAVDIRLSRVPMFVPFSNGRRKSRVGDGKMVEHYDQREMMMRRLDLPTCDDLIEAIRLFDRDPTQTFRDPIVVMDHTLTAP